MISFHVRFSNVEHPRVLFNENLGQITFIQYYTKISGVMAMRIRRLAYYVRK